jgi:hypothetical protein
MQVRVSRSRRGGIGAQCPEGFRLEFLMKIRRFELSDLSPELVHESLSDINKSKRKLFANDAISDRE